MIQNRNENTLKIVLLAFLAAAVAFTACILCAGIGYFVFYARSATPAVIVQVTGQVAPTKAPVVNLQGIWQQNGSMGAGWADRYHFYSSGTFHFYPNEMACSLQKIEKIGTWKLENTQLTLTETSQVILSFEEATGGFCELKDKKENDLVPPIVEQLTVVDLGTREGDIYPSITLNGQQFWRFSEDAASYGDEKFPE